jgi:hypothetical protein
MSHPGSLLRRRPSAAMVIALVALFVALGGVGYAAVSLPAGSVGRAQIQNNAVNYTKIEPGTIGIARINTAVVQVRVSKSCGTGAAISAIGVKGAPTCVTTAPAEFDTSNQTAQPIAGSATPTAVSSESLSGSTSYLISAAPYVTVTGTAGSDQQVLVTCELVDGTNVQVRNATFDLGADHEGESGSIPLEITSGPSTGSQTVTVLCAQSSTSAVSGAATPTVKSIAQINAVQTSSNTSESNTTAPYSLALRRNAAAK